MLRGSSPVAGGLVLPSFTWANRPTVPANTRVNFSDLGNTDWIYNGSRWKPVNGHAIIATLDSPSSGINASESIVFQYQLGAGLLGVGDLIGFRGTLVKSGTTNTGTLNIRVGTAGTTADTIMNNGAATFLSASQRTSGPLIDIRLESATTMREMGINNGSVTGYGAVAAAGAQSAAQTLASGASNADPLFVSVGIIGGATDSVVLAAGAQIEIRATTN